MAISFNQVANPSFSDSNKLLEIALAQSGKAAEGLQGTLNTAVTNVEDANLAKIRQLVDSQSREQLQDPVHQQLMQKQITDMTAATGGTYDPLKVADYQDKRIDTLSGREVTQSNLNGAAITQKAGQLRNDHDAVMNPYIQSAAGRKEVSEEESFVATKLSRDLDYFNKQGDALDRAIAAESDPTKKAELQKRKGLLGQDMEATIGTYGDIEPRIYSLAFEALEAKDKEEEDRDLKRLDALSVVKKRATDGVNQTQSVVNDTARTDAGILNDVANTGLRGLEIKNRNSSNKFSQKVTEAKGVMEKYGLPSTAVDADGTKDYKAIANQTRNRANEAAKLATQGEATSYQDYALSIKDNTLSSNQMEDLQAVMESKDIPDYQRIAYLKTLQMSPDKANNLLGFSSKSAIEKGLSNFLATYTTSDAARKAGQAHAQVYQQSINALTDLNESPYEIVKHLGLTLDFEGVEYLPQEIKDELGFDLAKHRKNQARKQAKANNQHTPDAKADFAKHEKEWKYKQDKEKTATELLIQGLGDDAKGSPQDLMFGDSMQNSANYLLRKLRGE